MNDIGIAGWNGLLLPCLLLYVETDFFQNVTFELSTKKIDKEKLNFYNLIVGNLTNFY